LASFECGGSWRLINPTLILTSDKSNVALLTPTTTPAILDDPKVLITFCAISHNGDPVVEIAELVPTNKWVSNASKIELPENICINL
jgi:hypothetical protein